MDDGPQTTKKQWRKMAFKFERLEVWQMALNYIDLVYEMADTKLPKSSW